MNDRVFSERVNAVSSLISNMTKDVAERYGLAAAVAELYRCELENNLTIMSAKKGVDNAGTSNNAPASGTANGGQAGNG